MCYVALPSISGSEQLLLPSVFHLFLLYKHKWNTRWSFAWKHDIFTRENDMFSFFSFRERAAFNKSCNLIGSGRGRNFLIRPAHGGRNPSLAGCVSLCDDLKFPFLLTPNPFTYRSYFLLDKRFGIRIWIKNISLWNVQFVSLFNTAFAVKRGASQQLKRWF